jgi:hypothetical protein
VKHDERAGRLKQGLRWVMRLCRWGLVGYGFYLLVTVNLFPLYVEHRDRMEVPRLAAGTTFPANAEQARARVLVVDPPMLRADWFFGDPDPDGSDCALLHREPRSWMVCNRPDGRVSYFGVMVGAEIGRRPRDVEDAVDRLLQVAAPRTRALSHATVQALAKDGVSEVRVSDTVAIRRETFDSGAEGVFARPVLPAAVH